jgi:predicted nucleotidyltransferase
MRRDEILTEIRSRLEKAFGDRLQGIVLYGSRARGNAVEQSDLDLMVLLAGTVRLGRDLEKIIDALYPVQLEIELAIHALPVSHTVFEAGLYTLHRNAKEEGVFF